MLPRVTPAPILHSAALVLFVASQALGSSLPVDGEWNEIGPAYRTEQVAVLDPLFQRVLVIGGLGGPSDLIWQVSLDGDWIPIRTNGTPPVSRRGMAGIYDPIRKRVLVFGGSPGPNGSSLWALSLSGTPAWSEIVTGSPQPPRTYYHTAIYDPVRDRMLVLFGGDSNGQTIVFRNDVWALALSGTPAWTHLAPAGTPPDGRGLTQAVYDSLRDRVLVFGGHLGCEISGWEPYCDTSQETWSLELADQGAWVEIQAQGNLPARRCLHGALYDPVRDRLVIFGGEEIRPFLSNTMNDTWSLPLTGTPAWSELTVTGDVPVPREGATALYDPAGNRMILCGGSIESGSFLTNLLTLPFDTNIWSELQPVIPARVDHTAEYDPDGDRMIVFGGRLWGDDYFPDSLYNETWAIARDGSSSWTRLDPAGPLPPKRWGHVSIYDPKRKQIVIFGGQGESGRLNDAWTLSLQGPLGWSQILPSGSPPPGLVQSAGIFDPIRDRLLIVGGWGGSRRAETWALNLVGPPEWQLVPALNATGVNDHSAIYDAVRDRMIVFGGTRSDFTDETYALNLSGTPAWTLLTTSGDMPGPHFWHSAIHDLLGDRMLVFGGRASSLSYAQTWALSLSEPYTWTLLSPARQLPPARWDHTAIMDTRRHEMVIFGGTQGFYRLDNNDMWALSFGAAPSGVEAENRRQLPRVDPPHPNPFRTFTVLRFELAVRENVRVSIFDVSGRLVRCLIREERNAGRHEILWDGRDDLGQPAPSAPYFVKIEKGNESVVERVVLLR